MLTFPPFDPDAERVLTFDCVKQLNPDEVLQGGITLKGITVTAGTDPNPLNMILGPPSYDATGTMMLLPVGNLSAMVGNDYEIELESATTTKFNVIVARGLLQVQVS
jgi:hypothetical protein